MNLKRITGFILSILMFFNISVNARNVSTYDYLVSQNSEVLTRLSDAGLSNTRINEFLSEMDNTASKLQVPEDIETLKEYFLVLLFNVVLADESFADVCGAFDMAFQPELEYMLENNMELPEVFSEFFLSVMYDLVKVEIPEETPPEPEEEFPEEIEPPSPVKPVDPEVEVFQDVGKNFWAYEHIISLYERGIIDGYGDGAFKPDNKITRAELAKIVCNTFLSKRYKAKESRYSDVSDSVWYSEYVRICEYYSLFDMILENQFDGDEYVTRQELCTVIYRAVLNSSVKLESYKKNDFLDRDLLAPYAVEAVEKLQSAGIINGFEDYKFHPFKETTRAELCKIINCIIL